MAIVERVNNTDIEYEWLEAREYLLVESKTEGPLLFTKTQIKHARDRAIKQPEDSK